MVAVLQQPGSLSAFGYAVEASAGTFLTATDMLDVDTLQVMDNPDILQFPVMRRNRNVIHQTRPGVHKITASITAPAYAIQGAAMWRAMIGFDTLTPTAAATTTALAASCAAGATSLSSTASIPAGSFIILDSFASGVQETMKTGTPSGAGPFTIPITGDGAGTGTRFAHASAASVTIATGGVSSAASAGASQVIVTALPALPAAVAEYTALFIQLDRQKVEITSVTGAGPFTLGISPALTSALTVNDAAHIGQQHVIQENPLATAFTLATMSLIAQFAQMHEWDMPYCFAEKGGLKGDNKTLKADFGFCASALPTPTTSLTSIPQSVGEQADLPWVMKEGGLTSFFTTADANPVMHGRLLSLDWTFDNGMIPRTYGGGVQLAEFYVPGERKQSVKWKEDLGQVSAAPDIWTNYVKTQTNFPAFATWVNAATNNGFGIWWPLCRVLKYDPITALNDVIGFDGELLPLMDPTSAKSVKLVIDNGVVGAAY